MNASAPSTRVRAVAIVPARLGSTRLARKMLLAETGAPLFVHTARSARSCGAIERVVVATDSDEILAAAREADVEALATRADHPSGTDRVREALEALEARGESWDVVLNVQGDEPELDPADLGQLVAAFADPGVVAATLAAELEDPAELASPDVVKVVCDARGDALYFSRAALPCRERQRAVEAAAPARRHLARRHIGVYAYRPDALRRFCELPVGALEAAENLEQLRWLEAGQRMRVVRASSVPPGIDTRADYEAFVRRLSHAPQPAPSKRP